MWWRIGKLAASSYAVLWIAAVGGLVGAKLSGILGAAFFVTENKGVYVQPWVHGGWYIGTILALVGAITGEFRRQSGSWLKLRKPTEISPETLPSPEAAENDSKPSNVLSAAGGLGLIGGFLGAILGCSLLVFWFSLAYSPFAPTGWASSIEVKRERLRPGQIERPVMATDHPITLYLVAVPAVIGVITGAVGGGIGAALGKVRDA